MAKSSNPGRRAAVTSIAAPVAYMVMNSVFGDMQDDPDSGLAIGLLLVSSFSSG